MSGNKCWIRQGRSYRVYMLRGNLLASGHLAPIASTPGALFPAGKPVRRLAVGYRMRGYQYEGCANTTSISELTLSRMSMGT